MFTGNWICTSFKNELLQKKHNLALDTFKLALYTNAASLDAATGAYSATGESAGTGYTAGGVVLSGNTVAVIGSTVIVSFANPSLAAASITFRGALIYNSSVVGNPAVAVLDFGADKTYVGQPVTIQFPPADADNALIRI